jgi:hypothetical protein
MADQHFFGQQRVATSSQTFAPGARAYFYVPGTLTLQDVFADEAYTVLHPSPLVADGGGFFPQVWCPNAVKVIVYADAGGSDGPMLPGYPLDPAFRAFGDFAGASQVSFAPTVNLPFTDLQQAIEGSDTNWRTAIAAAGFGVTGNAPALADLDATNTPSGFYRFTATTTGTFPTGITAASTGVVELLRQNATLQTQTIRAAGADLTFERRWNGGAWQPWAEVIKVSQGGVRGNLIRRGASAWERLALGTARQVPMSDGTDLVNGDLTGASASVPTTSGATADVTGIPSWATEVTLHFIGTSAASAVSMRVRVGGASGFVTTGYISTASRQPTSGNVTSSTTSFVCDTDTSASDAIYGHMTLKKSVGNQWSQSHTVLASSTNVSVGAGHISMSEALTQLRVFPASGDFDAGAVCATWR